MGKIDYANVITSNDLDGISTEKYQQALELGRIEVAKQEKQCNLGRTHTGRQLKDGYSFPTGTKIDRASEIFRFKYKDLSEIERHIICSSYLFSSESFIKKLIEMGYNFVDSFKLARLIRSTKTFILTAKEEELDPDIQIANKKLEAICKAMELYYGIHDYNAIINKLVQVVWFEQGLFKEIARSNDPANKTFTKKR